ncbi:addiction module protein [Rhodohalobacter sp.]|uniref:addiction module protein n=1 Tax=Rhodohalobacter sp. TaxID=1974210 RepID=UPI00356AA11B
MIKKADIEQLSISEQLETMEMLWESLSSKPDKVSSPDWHAEVLKAREAKINSGKEEYLTIDELKEKLSQ